MKKEEINGHLGQLDQLQVKMFTNMSLMCFVTLDLFSDPFGWM